MHTCSAKRTDKQKKVIVLPHAVHPAVGPRWEGLNGLVWALFFLVLGFLVAVVVYLVKRHVDRQLDQAWNGVNPRGQAANRLLRNTILGVLAVTVLVVGLLVWAG